MGPVPAPGLVDDSPGLLYREDQPLQAVADAKVGPQRPLAGPDGPGDEPHHTKVALEAPHLGLLPTVVHPDAPYYIPQGGHLDPGLPE